MLTPDISDIVATEEATIDEGNDIALSIIDSVLPIHNVMIVLCGIPGSGKSTFARNLLNSIPKGEDRKWASCNQDALGDRGAVVNAVRNVLHHHGNVVVDRCNFDYAQRRHWIELAQEYHLSAVIAVVMPNFDNVSLCAERAYKRGNSDGIHPGNPNWDGICADMMHKFVLPSPEEGFSGLYLCHNQADVDRFLRFIASKYRPPTV